MKYSLTILILFATICFIHSLHLSSHKLTKEQPLLMSHKISYHGRHYKSHRTAEYIEKVKQENLLKIEKFNEQNKKKFRPVSEDQHLVKGGCAYSLGPNPFIQFTPEEFDKSFKGLVLSDEAKQHYGRIHEQQMHNMEFQHEKHSNATHENPYLIGDEQLQNLYGDVNSEDNYGWDWKKYDQNYYKQSLDDNYWRQWQKQHWNSASPIIASQHMISLYHQWKQEQNKKDQQQHLETQTSHISSHSLDHLQSGTLKRAIKEFKSDEPLVDWNKAKATTHIKQQGECGSCWAFGTVAIVESYYMIMGKGALDLSEQQLVDCQTNQDGCDGGWPQDVLQWISRNGLVTEQRYPYEGVKRTCRHRTGSYKIPGSSHVKGRAAIQAAIRKGPVSAAMNSEGTEYYSRGIFDRCKSGQVDHAVILVGYTKDYWIIRNSWGTSWGENGHMRLKKNQTGNNACRIENFIMAIKY